MNKEIDEKYNKGLKGLSDDLYMIRKIEMSNKSKKEKYTNAKPIIDEVTDRLVKRNDYLTFRPFWNELHDRMVYYYSYLNLRNLDKSEIPIFRVVLHNSAVVWWLKYKKTMKNVSIPIVHFDTHDDMGLPGSTKGLLKNGELDEAGIIAGNCGQIYWPITCMLMSRGIDHVIWALPEWVYDDNLSLEQTLVTKKKGKGFSYIRDKNAPKDKYQVEDIEIVDKINKNLYKFIHKFQFDRITMDVRKDWTELGHLLGKDVTDFILDIDLDFFVTNGDKHTKKEYKKDFYDLESTGRIHDMPGIRVPREAYSDENADNIKYLLNEEFKLIKKRVKIFLSGLKYLKKKGIVPCCISISDSTPSFFVEFQMLLFSQMHTHQNILYLYCTHYYTRGLTNYMGQK